MFLCIVQNYWGRGETIDAAKAQAKKAGGSLKSYVIFESDDPKISVDEMGYICYDRDKTYKEVLRYPKSLK